MHFMVSAPGHATIVTHTFDGTDAYIGDDAVFGVKETLVAPFVPVTDGTVQWRPEFHFVMVADA